MEHVVPMGKNRAEGLPTVYKVDIASPELMIAIEVNGGSHGSLRVQAADKRKTEALAGRGWTVLSFTNKEVTGSLADCVQTVMSTISKSKGSTPTSLAGS